jgi:hypothetical protein
MDIRHIGVRILTGAEIFLFFTASTRALEHMRLYIHRTPRAVSLGVKLPGCETGPHLYLASRFRIRGAKRALPTSSRSNSEKNTRTTLCLFQVFFVILLIGHHYPFLWNFDLSISPKRFRTYVKQCNYYKVDHSAPFTYCVLSSIQWFPRICFCSLYFLTRLYIYSMAYNSKKWFLVWEFVKQAVDA